MYLLNSKSEIILLFVLEERGKFYTSNHLRKLRERYEIAFFISFHIENNNYKKSQDK